MLILAIKGWYFVLRGSRCGLLISAFLFFFGWGIVGHIAREQMTSFWYYFYVCTSLKEDTPPIPYTWCMHTYSVTSLLTSCGLFCPAVSTCVRHIYDVLSIHSYMSTHKAIAVILSVFCVCVTAAASIDRWADVQEMGIQYDSRCSQQGYTIERMDLIPYGKCMCNEAQHCYCYPI